MVLGYDLESANLQGINKDDVPDVVICKKHYPKTRDKTKNKKRNWKLKHINKDANKQANSGKLNYLIN